MDTKPGIELPATEPRDMSPSRFLGVVPIARAAETDHLVIVLVALERFDTYSNLAMQLFIAAAHPHAGRDPGQMIWPMPVVAATDDLGTTYRAEPGGGIGGNQHYQLDCTLTPAIPERAGAISLALEGVDWKDPDNGQLPKVTTGRWRFEVDLASQVNAFQRE